MGVAIVWRTFAPVFWAIPRRPRLPPPLDCVLLTACPPFLPPQLEEWWEYFAYLQPRYPTAININWHGVMPGTWGSLTVSQTEAAAMFTRHILAFRETLVKCVPALLACNRFRRAGQFLHGTFFDALPLQANDGSRDLGAAEALHVSVLAHV